MTKLVTGPTGLAVGSSLLVASLYEVLLQPRVASLSGSILGVVPGTSTTSGVIDATHNRVAVTSLGGYPSTGGTSIGTVTVGAWSALDNAPNADIATVNVDVRSVDPFSGMTTSATAPDLNDYWPVKQFVPFSGNQQVFGNNGIPSVTASASSTGVEIVVNPGGTTEKDITQFFNVGSGRSLSWNKTELAQANGKVNHTGGHLSYRVTVTNSHSHERIFRQFATGKLFVHGALGPVLTQNGSGNYIVYAAAVGNTASYMNVETSLESSVRFIRMTGSGPLNQTFTYNGQSYQVVSVSEASGGFTSFIGYSAPIYSFSLSPATPSVAPIYYIDKLPAFIGFVDPDNTTPPGTVYDASSSSDPVFYLEGTSGESWYNNNKGDCGFYVIHLLGNITTSQTWAGAD